MLYHLSLLLHVHNYYVQLCLFYHTAAISFVSHFYCIIYAILTRIAITPYTIVYNNNMQVSWCICLHYYTICIFFFFEKKIYFIQKKTNRQKKYIYTLQNLYTHTINIEHIIYMQESSGQPHIDQYRSAYIQLMYSLYTSND